MVDKNAGAHLFCLVMLEICSQGYMVLNNEEIVRCDKTLLTSRVVTREGLLPSLLRINAL